MFRSRNERQSESARRYLDFAAVSPALENAAEVTARALGFPLAMVHILDDTNQYTLVGFGAGDIAGTVTPRTRAACTSVVESGISVVVEDAEATGGSTGAHDDPPEELVVALRESGVRAYAAVPLFGRESVPIGTLCVLDFAPHSVSRDRLELLEQLAVMVEEHLDTQRSRARVQARTATVGELTHAVDSGQITPFYQPIVDLATGTIYALEALARWNHPSKGLIEPGSFIEQLENTDLIADLDLGVLSAALVNFRDWSAIQPDLKLSVNISGLHLERKDCVERLVDTVRSSGASPRSVVLEITETARGPGIEEEARIVAEMRACGFTVLLDDLGSGWSPVPRLTNVMVDGFKLDRSVAASLHTKVGEAVAHAMLRFASDLEHRLVLEGIETPSRLIRARELGFTHGQGHYFSKPVPAEDVRHLLERDAAGAWSATAPDREN